MKKTVFLIGFMGSGKTYWAQRMAAKMRILSYDLDAMVEAMEELTVQEVFEQMGEKAFRETEQECLQHCIKLDPGIVATGGGTPCFFENMAWMNTKASTIYLNTPAPLLADRLKQDLKFRPLLANVAEYDLEAHIEKLLEKRRRYYEQATIILDQTADNALLYEDMLYKAIKYLRE